MVMQFSVVKVRTFLLEHLYVYTFRVRKRKHVGKDWASTGRGKPKFAEIYINFVKPITDLSEELPYYVSRSGFNSLKEWIDVIAKINPVYVTGFLYRVALLHKSVIELLERV